MFYLKGMNVITVDLKIFILPGHFNAFNFKRQLRRNRPKRIYHAFQSFWSDNGKRLCTLRIAYSKKQPRKTADMVCMKMRNT